MVSAAFGDRPWLNFASLVQISLLTVAMLAVLRRVVTAPEVGFRTILGAVSVYTVLGILFTFVYGALDRMQGGAFFEGVPHPQGSDFLFFSYTTLTTTGYGNLVPGGQPGRMISGLEMMIGQIFLVTLVAGLVSLWRPGEAIRRRREHAGRRLTQPASTEPSSASWASIPRRPGRRVRAPRVGDPVERARSLLAAGDEALGPQRGEVLGDVLLGGAERLGQLPDRGLLAAAQQVEDPQPGRVGEGAEAAGDQLGGIVVSGLFIVCIVPSTTVKLLTVD